MERGARSVCVVALVAVVAGGAAGVVSRRGLAPEVAGAQVEPRPAYLPMAYLGYPAWPGRVPTAAHTPTPSATPTITLAPAPTSTPTATTTSTPPPTPTSDLPAWQQYVNYHRSLADLPPITENEEWSRGCELHSRYMVKNGAIGHSESPGNPYYTKEGADAASGNVYGTSQIDARPEDAIDAWMTGPFHMLQIINPTYAVGGYGEYSENIGNLHFAATLDVNRGRGELPAELTFPVYYPENGRHIPNLAYGGGESPNPLVTCPGYSPPTGPPLALQLGTGNVTPQLGRTSFRRGSEELPHCVYDETKYPSGVGQLILNARDAIILMPRSPLTPGETYTASIEVNGSTYTWSFKAGAPALATVGQAARSAGGMAPLPLPVMPAD